jgi:hypothetical protein
LALACAAIQSASAFSIYGPAEAWQVPTLDYLTRYYYPVPSVGATELGAPKNFDLGSRINTPIITYSYDVSFLSYFGEQGVAAIDSAMAVLNALPDASSADLSKFLMQGNQQINYTAQALQLTDLKSIVLGLMMEHVGLAGETHVWDLHTRNAEPGPPPCLFEYAVIERNYDPVTFQPSSYVNGVNYNYQIWDGCSNSISVADAIEIPVDEASAAGVTYTAVSTLYALEPGGYYLGLTYDDMGGIKFLYRKDRFENETLDPTAAVTAFSASSSSYEGVTDTNATGGVTGVTTTTPAATNFVGFLGGVEKITYVKLPSVSTIAGSGFVPRTFSYSLPAQGPNGAIQSLHITRTVVQPDIVFSAADLVGNTLSGVTFTYDVYARGFNFITTAAPVVNGFPEVVPQVISPQETITFNNNTPLYVNLSPSFLDNESIFGFPVLLWGTFDGTTNAPVVYPEGSSGSQLIAELFSGAGAGSGAPSTTWLGLSLSTNAGVAAGGATP